MANRRQVLAAGCVGLSGMAASLPPVRADAAAPRFAPTAAQQALLAIGRDPLDYVEVNGVSLRYQLTGRRGAPVVLLAHEISTNLQTWDYLVPALRERYRLLRFDWRCFGLSEKPHREFDLTELLGDINGLLDAFDIREPVILVGGSVGGAALMQYAGHFPERTRALLAMIPGVGSIGIPFYPQPPAGQTRPTAERFQEARAMADALTDNEWPEPLRSSQPDKYRYWRGMKLANDPIAWPGFGRWNRIDHRPNFARIRCPSVMVGATLFEEPRPPAQVRWVASQIRDSRYVEVNSGHYMAYQSPELFLPVLQQFLREVAG